MDLYNDMLNIINPFWNLPHAEQSSCLNECLADNATNVYFEDIALDRESRMLYLTSQTEGSLMQVKAKEGSQLEPFLINKASRPTGIAIDPCSRSMDYFEHMGYLFLIPSLTAFIYSYLSTEILHDH